MEQQSGLSYVVDGFIIRTEIRNI